VTDVVVAYFKVLSWHLLAELKKIINTGLTARSRDSNLVPTR